MDSSGLTAAITNTLRNSMANSNFLECIIGTVIAIAVLRLEVTRRTAAPQDVGLAGRAASINKYMRRFAPEIISLASCLALGVTLRVIKAPKIGDTADDKAYAEIMKQWPILLTADTLLALQAMLRLLVLISTVLRKSAGPTLLSQEVAAISLGAALGRAVLAAHSNVYQLDGPLGAYLPIACEVLSVPLLAILTKGINRNALIVSVTTLAAAAWIGSRNQLALAGDGLTDALFIFAHIAELIAAFAYMSRGLLLDTGLNDIGDKSVALHFAHMLMPVQQCMAAYYFVQAFEYVPELVSVGHPFEILTMGGVAQVGAYAGAAILHMAEYLESPSQESDQDIDASSEHQRAMTNPQLAPVPQRAAGLVF